MKLERRRRRPLYCTLHVSLWLACGSMFADRPRFLVIRCRSSSTRTTDGRRRRTNYPRTNFPRVKPTWGHPPSTNAFVLHTFRCTICEDQQIDDGLQHANGAARLYGDYHFTYVIYTAQYVNLWISVTRAHIGLPDDQPQVLIRVPLNFCPKSWSQLPHRLSLPSPFPLPPSSPQISVFPFSALLSRPSPPFHSNLRSIRMAFSPGSLTRVQQPRSHRRRRRRTRRRDRGRDRGREGRRPYLPLSLVRSFLRSFSFPQRQRLPLPPLPPLPPFALCHSR